MMRFWRSDAKSATRELEEARAARRLALHAAAKPVGNTRVARSLIAWTIGAFVFAIAWAAVTPVTETVTGEGRILPAGGERPVQTLDGGLVVKVLVAEGDSVAAGAPLVLFDRSEDALALKRLQARWEGRTAERARFVALAGGWTFDPPPTDAGAEQAKAFAAEQTVNEAILERLRASAVAAERQVAFAAARIGALQEELSLAGAGEARSNSLSERGLVSEKRREEAVRARLRVAQDLAEAESEEAEARVAAADADLAIARHIADRRAQAADRAAALAVEIAELDEEIARRAARVARDRVVAPVDGRIQDLNVRDPGQTVLAGGTVASVVPEGRELFAEMLVSADRVGDVKEGLTASVKVLAYDYARFGALPAAVVAVSPSSQVDERGNVFFRVRLRLLESAGAIDVRPGLSVTADLRTGEKTVLEYFAKPIRVLRDRAFSEA